jgi:enterobactin synthetase component D
MRLMAVEEILAFNHLSSSPGRLAMYCAQPPKMASGVLQSVEVPTLRSLASAAATAALSVLSESDLTMPHERSEQGEPNWPRGFLGSLAHTTNLGIAIVGKSTDYIAIGIDCELSQRKLSEAAAKRVCTEAELNILHENSMSPLLAFGCKETIYKALFPSVRRYFGFRAAQLVAANDTTCCFKLEEHLSNEWHKEKQLEVSWSQWREYLITAIAIPR